MSLCFLVLMSLCYSWCNCFPAGNSNEIQKRIFADTLSKMFDLPMTSSKHNRMQAPPEYMVNLYNRVALPNGLPREFGAIPHGAKVIRSFEMSATTGADSLDTDKGTAIYFNVSGISNRETVLEAEFRVFKLKSPQTLENHIFKVHVYQIMDNSDLSVRRKLDMQLVKTHGTPEWSVFSVGRAVQDWVSGAQENHGLLLLATDMEGAPIPLHLGYQQKKLPLLVLYDSEDREQDNSKIVFPVPNLITSELHNSSSRIKRETPTASCVKQDMRLNFEDIGFENIVSPAFYNAFWCEGRCPFPLGQEVAPTNHAMVQSIAHNLGLGGGGVGMPSCVPSRLLPVTILFFDQNNNTVMKQQEDMVADECACQ